MKPATINKASLLVEEALRIHPFIKIGHYFLLMAIILSTNSSCFAGDPDCCHCGNSDCHKVCKLVKEEKKIQVTCWGYKDEPFCVSSPNEPDCKNTESICEDSNNKQGVVSCPKKFSWTSWNYSDCPDVFTRRKLMKKTVTKTVPSYKWVYVNLCKECETKIKTAETIRP